ncbi:hypothetical protein DXU85_21190 [Pseudomonas savastanoi]|uniref:Uncharacterized protein n=1 Tax=Pseudomonas savastanoi pv. savastanoi NCPPB 3335 TaxID=693985 RepID=A0ABC8BH60_PSESS|nr:hypothetical protein PSA3335_23410 [Pseudomonas savastanoi pv. savastanoi NCPPB 3335]KAA3538434.1 hypothetical protein DXU85_21190 [Pseudomonas savastanoi]
MCNLVLRNFDAVTATTRHLSRRATRSVELARDQFAGMDSASPPLNAIAVGEGWRWRRLFATRIYQKRQELVPADTSEEIMAPEAMACLL